MVSSSTGHAICSITCAMKARGYCLLDAAWGEIKLSVWERRERVRCAMGSLGVGCTVVGMGAVCVLALVRLAIECGCADAVCNGVGATLGSAFCGGITLGALCSGEGVTGSWVHYTRLYGFLCAVDRGGWIYWKFLSWYGSLLWAVAGSPVFKGSSKVFECA